jgi:hypothetical protein
LSPLSAALISFLGRLTDDFNIFAAHQHAFTYG